MRLANLIHLGRKELVSLAHDRVLVLLIVYSFTVMVAVTARAAGTDVRNASIAFVLGDPGALAQRLVDAVQPPYFQRPALITPAAADLAQDRGRYTFVVDVPPRFQADLEAGRVPVLQIAIDATAMSQAGVGSGYLQQIFAHEIAAWLREAQPPPAVQATIRVDFNPNLHSAWFLGAMMVVNVVTLLAVILTGSAMIREREQGTLEHLLVLPLSATEIMLAKTGAMALVIVAAAAASMELVVHRYLGMPIRGSLALFLAGTTVYVFAVSALGIFLATVARSMPQLGLLGIPIVFPMTLLSGGVTPLDGMPAPIRLLMQLSPSTHFVAFAQKVLFRGADLALAWPELALTAAIGTALFVGAAARLRRTLALAAG